MIVVPIKDNETLDKALKRFRRKIDDLKLLQNLKSRTYYTKPSDKRRNEKSKATYRYKMRQEAAS